MSLGTLSLPAPPPSEAGRRVSLLASFLAGAPLLSSLPSRVLRGGSVPSGALIASGGRTWPSPGRAVPRLRGLCVSGLEFSPSLSCRSCGRASPRGQMPVILLEVPTSCPRGRGALPHRKGASATCHRGGFINLPQPWCFPHRLPRKSKAGGVKNPPLGCGTSAWVMPRARLGAWETSARGGAGLALLRRAGGSQSRDPQGPSSWRQKPQEGSA